MREGKISYHLILNSKIKMNDDRRSVEMEYRIDEIFPIGATMFTDVFDYVDTIFLLACENITAFLAENSASTQYSQ